MSDDYDATYLKDRPLPEQYFHEFCDAWYISRLLNMKCKTVLDVGGGDGRLTMKLKDAGFNVTYIDTSQVLVDNMKGKVPAIKTDFFAYQPTHYDALIFSFGVLNHFNLDDALSHSHSFTPKTVLGWISNTRQLEHFVKMDKKTLRTVLENDFDYSVLSQFQYGVDYHGPIRNYSKEELNAKGFTTRPFPTLLWLPDWKNPNPASLDTLLEWDLHPERMGELPDKLCTGFLVERRYE